MTERKLKDLDEAARSLESLWLESYDEGVFRTFAQKHATIKEAMLAHLKDGGAARPLIRHRGECVTRAQADEAACRLANGLMSRGVEAGDRVSIVVSNRPEVVVSFMACYKAGFVAAAYNQRCTAREIVGSMAIVASRVLIVERETLPKVLPAIREGALPRLGLVVVLDGDERDAASSGVSAAGYERLLREGAPVEPDVAVSADDDAILLFTGGTTGVSKGCCQTHGRMVFELECMGNWCAPALKTPYPSFLVCMPMTHIMGINYGVNWQLVNGGSVVIGDGHKPADIVYALNAYRPTAWAALPTLLHSVSADASLESSGYRDLELVIFGGSFIAKDTIEALRVRTNASFVESYGMSESFGFVTCNPVRSMGKVGSIGLPVSETDVLVVDLETGTRVLGANERGEIVFRGPQVVREYWRNPEETALALREGWLFSGDIGYRDEDGYLYLVDRKKDTIVVSGFNVFPKEIDETLMAHPDVVDACTIGVPDEHSGERPKSFVVLRPGAKLDAGELISFCKRSLVAYKAPKHLEEIAQIPKTKARKPDRAALRREEERRRAASADADPAGSAAKIPVDSQET